MNICNYIILTDPVSKWQSVAKDNVNYHRVWRDYVQMINPELTFTEFEDFFVDEGISLLMNK